MVRRAACSGVVWECRGHNCRHHHGVLALHMTRRAQNQFIYFARGTSGARLLWARGKGSGLMPDARVSRSGGGNGSGQPGRPCR
jgi:hypothetical protein